MTTLGLLALVIVIFFITKTIYNTKPEVLVENNANTVNQSSDNSKQPTVISDVNAQEQTQKQQNSGNAGGNKLSSSGILEKDSAPFIYKNGVGGFNYCFVESQVLEFMTGDFGVTKAGVYFVSEDLYNKRRPAGAVKLKFEGVATSNDVFWEYKDCELKDGYYQCNAGLVYQDDGDCLFCFAYFDANDKCLEQYLPHRSVKGGVSYVKEIR